MSDLGSSSSELELEESSDSRRFWFSGIKETRRIPAFSPSSPELLCGCLTISGTSELFSIKRTQ